MSINIYMHLKSGKEIPQTPTNITEEIIDGNYDSRLDFWLDPKLYVRGIKLLVKYLTEQEAYEVLPEVTKIAQDAIWLEQYLESSVEMITTNTFSNADLLLAFAHKAKDFYIPSIEAY